MSRQIFEYDPIIAYRFIPGLKARVPHEAGGYMIRVNSSGFRSDREFTASKTPGTRRILLFGDSFTAGDGVPNAHRFGDVLEQFVPRTEVYNFGLPGSGTDQHYLIWQKYGRAIEHDLVILAVQVENIRRVVAKYRRFADDSGKELLYAKPFYELSPGGLELRNSPPERKPLREDNLPAEDREMIDNGGPHMAARALIRGMGLGELAQRLTQFQPLPEYSDPENKAWKILRALISAWVAGENKPVILAPLPIYQYIEETSDPSPYRTRFREAALESGAILHDPLPDFWKVPKDDRRNLRFKKDIHMNARGHRLLAESLAPAVAGVLAGGERKSA